MIEDGPEDPLACDVVHVFSQRYMQEQGLAIETPFIADIHRARGDVVTIYFPSIANLVIFLRESAPRRILYHMRVDESAAASDIERAVRSEGPADLRDQPAVTVLH